MTAPPPQPAAVQVDNYDVLLLGSPTSSSASASSTDNMLQLLQLDQSRRHVGNNRFEVLLRMNAGQVAGNAAATPADLQAVTERIVVTVCQQVQPNGRFLLKQQRTNEWIQLGPDAVQAFVTQSLRALLPAGHAAAAAPPPAAPMAPMLGLLGEGPLSPTTRNSNTDANQQQQQLRRPSKLVSPMPASGTHSREMSADDRADLLLMLGPQDHHHHHHPSSTQDAEDVESAEQKKRRRRSSLLRRSASESILFQNAAFDKKKSVRKHTLLDQDMNHAASFVAALDMEQSLLELDDNSNSANDLFAQQEQHQQQHRQQATLFEGRGRSGSFEAQRCNVVTTAEPLDVIFAPTLTVAQFSACVHAGNNRLRVLLGLQQARYLQVSSQATERVAVMREIRDTVLQHWGGRFLMETETGYLLMVEQDASVMITSLLDQQLPHFDESSATNSYLPLSPAVTSAVAASTLQAQQQQQQQQQHNGMHQANAAPDMALSSSSTTKPAGYAMSASAISNNFQSLLPKGSEEMSKLAVQTLHKQKKKNTTLNKVRGWTEHQATSLGPPARNIQAAGAEAASAYAASRRRKPRKGGPAELLSRSLNHVQLSQQQQQQIGGLSQLNLPQQLQQQGPLFGRQHQQEQLVGDNLFQQHQLSSLQQQPTPSMAANMYAMPPTTQQQRRPDRIFSKSLNHVDSLMSGNINSSAQPDWYNTDLGALEPNHLDYNSLQQQHQPPQHQHQQQQQRQQHYPDRVGSRPGDRMDTNS